MTCYSAICWGDIYERLWWLENCIHRSSMTRWGRASRPGEVDSISSLPPHNTTTAFCSITFFRTSWPIHGACRPLGCLCLASCSADVPQSSSRGGSALDCRTAYQFTFWLLYSDVTCKLPRLKGDDLLPQPLGAVTTLKEPLFRRKVMDCQGLVCLSAPSNPSSFHRGRTN